MSGKVGGIAVPTALGWFTAIQWLARHPNHEGRTDRETLELIARYCRAAIEREPLP
jgi:hypothetical protein